MVFPVLNFQPETFDEANPWVHAMDEARKAAAFQQEEAQAPLHQEYLQSQIQSQQARLPYIQAMAKQLQTKSDFPLLAQRGLAGQLGAVQYLRQQGHDDLAGQLEKGIAQDQQKQLAMQAYLNARAQGYNYGKLPINTRNMMLAYAGGMGYTPSEANQRFIQGATLNDLAKEKGVQLSDVKPTYAPTTQSLSLAQRRQAATSEIGAVTDDVTSALAPYARQFGGINPKLAINQLMDTNPDAVSKYLAATALSPELAAMRVSALGGRVGIEAIKHIAQLTYGNLAQYRSLVSPKVFADSQKYLNDWIERAVSAASKNVLNPLGQTIGPRGTQSPLVSSNKVKMEDENGKIWMVPDNKVALFKKNGYKEVDNG